MDNAPLDLNILLFNQYDPYQFRLTYEWCQKGMHYLAGKLTRDPDQAKDVVADVFCRVWERKIQFESLARLRAYLFTAVRNQSLDFLSTARHRNTRPLDPKQEWKVVESMDGELVRLDVYETLLPLIERLAPQQRLVVMKLLVEKKSRAQVAEELHIAVSTVNVHLKAAIAAIRKKLPPELLS